MGKLFYPKELSVLFSSEALEDRFAMDKRTRKILTAREQFAGKGELENIERLLSEENIILPCNDALTRLKYPINIIAATGLINGISFMLMGIDGSESPLYEGTGKTSLAWKLLGVEFPHQDITNNIEELRSMQPINISVGNPDRKMACSDIAFAGLHNGHLSYAVCMGGIALAQWDAARSIYRMKGSPLGPRNDPKVEEYLLECAKHIALPINAFVPESNVYQTDYIFIISRKNLRSGKNVKVNTVEERDFIAELTEILLRNPRYHTSTTWSINQDIHNARVAQTISRLTYIPRIIHLDIQKGKGSVPIEEAANVIRDIIS